VAGRYFTERPLVAGLLECCLKANPAQAAAARADFFWFNHLVPKTNRGAVEGKAAS
jgi:hypothetical protein